MSLTIIHHTLVIPRNQTSNQQEEKKRKGKERKGKEREKEKEN
jgi:hypothetical protein